MEPSKIAYEKAKEFDSKFEKYGMETAKGLLDEVTFRLGVS